MFYELNVLDGLNTIQLTRGQNCLVDAADFEWISKRRWYSGTKATDAKFYAVRSVRKGRAGSRTVRMHGEILERLSPRPEGMFGLHANDDSLDNRRSNLYFGTIQQNADDRVRNGNAMACPRGERHWNAKLTAADVISIRTAVAAGRSREQVADAFHVSQMNVSYIVAGVTWKHVAGPLAPRPTPKICG